MSSRPTRVAIYSEDDVEVPSECFDAHFGGPCARPETIAALTFAVWNGARVVRTNDVETARRICNTVAAVLDGTVAADG